MAYDTSIEKSCACKIPYETIEEASERKTYFEWLHGFRLQIYACGWCQGFHLTRARRNGACIEIRRDDAHAGT